MVLPFSLPFLFHNPKAIIFVYTNGKDLRCGDADQKQDEQDRFLKKEIDKTPKNGYILCINAMKKSVHRRQLSREPGQVKAGKCAGMRCRF